jgi:hypothetical protein
MGPVKKGDTLDLMESEREARRLRWYETLPNKIKNKGSLTIQDDLFST